MKKVYLHFEGDPPFTMVVRLEDDSQESADELRKVGGLVFIISRLFTTFTVAICRNIQQEVWRHAKGGWVGD